MRGLANVHLELSARCDKQCRNCQRRVAEIEAPDIVREWGFMPMALVRQLADDLPGQIVVSLHGRGEPLMYPRLQEALIHLSTKNRILHFDSNIKLLIHKADEVIEHLDVLTVSFLEGNSYLDNAEQYVILKKFLKIKRDRKPRVMLRMTGAVQFAPAWLQDLELPVVSRPLHHREGRKGYTSNPVMPEHGICLEMLSRLFISFDGEVRPCVRYDIWGENILDNVNEQTLSQIWNSNTRRERVLQHIAGQRLGFCNSCEFYGIPSH